MNGLIYQCNGYQLREQNEHYSVLQNDILLYTGEKNAAIGVFFESCLVNDLIKVNTFFKAVLAANLFDKRPCIVTDTKSGDEVYTVFLFETKTEFYTLNGETGKRFLKSFYIYKFLS